MSTSHPIHSYHFFKTTPKRVNVATKRKLTSGSYVTLGDVSIRVHEVKKQEDSKYYKGSYFYEIRYV